MVLTKTPICNFGEKPHSFELKGVDNKFYKFENLVGKNGILIMFICNHCPYVKAVIKDIVKDSISLKKEGVTTIAIMSNDTENLIFLTLLMKPKKLLKNMVQFVLQIFLDIIINLSFNIEAE